MFFQSMEQASYTYHDAENELYTTNNSQDNYTEIFLDQVYDDIENGSIEAWDPENSEAVVEQGENYTLIDQETGQINITDYYQEDPDTHDISFNYTSREGSQFTAPISIGFGFIQMFEGLIGIFSWILAAILMMVALYAAIKLSSGSNGGSA